MAYADFFNMDYLAINAVLFVAIMVASVVIATVLFPETFDTPKKRKTHFVDMLVFAFLAEGFLAAISFLFILLTNTINGY